ncbi:mRNA-decapping enzyme-like protein [Rhynchospora pubera]|uniref:mRNA-decapping enzyme-like protein n=1 Tax=Rhynchospora pubera TaxID=906938 RepID=A0AAV8DFL0_9POAL|nr:mRNA-decapping enzyme-like protein [Rhynchospora pubera]
MPHNGGKLTPNLDQGGTKVLNLTVLQRIDPSVEDILITASHVTLYDFNIDLNQWSRKDVEGSLFVVKRNTQPRFQFIVMNRRNTENLVEDLLGDFEYEVQPPYLLYRNATQEVNGIWFYNQADCEAVANLFGRILNAYSKVPPKAKVSSTKSEFEELEAVPNPSTIEGPLEPPMSSSTIAPEASEEVLANFFTAANNIGNSSAPAAAISMRSHQPEPIQPSIPPSASANPSHHRPSFATPSPSAPLVPLGDSRSASATANLVTPSFFQPTPSPSPPLAMPPPIISSSVVVPQPVPQPTETSVTRPYAAPPLLQPFPPPTPPPSLAPVPSVSGPSAHGSVIISRDKLRDALGRLVQNDQFIDMLYREIMNNSHYP